MKQHTEQQQSWPDQTKETTKISQYELCTSSRRATCSSSPCVSLGKAMTRRSEFSTRPLLPALPRKTGRPERRSAYTHYQCRTCEPNQWCGGKSKIKVIRKRKECREPIRHLSVVYHAGDRESIRIGLDWLTPMKQTEPWRCEGQKYHTLHLRAKKRHNHSVWPYLYWKKNMNYTEEILHFRGIIKSRLYLLYVYFSDDASKRQCINDQRNAGKLSLPYRTVWWSVLLTNVWIMNRHKLL